MTTIEKYEFLKGLVTSDRKEKFLDLMKWLETETTYLTSPASTKYHLCREGGLLEHLVSVAATMIRLKKTLAPEISDEQCVIVALLHDVGKVGLPGCPQYLVNEPTERQKQYGYPASTPYRINEDLVYMTHAHRSLYLICPRFDLLPEEAQAIVMHDGQYIEDNAAYKFKETKLSILLHYADYWDARFLNP